MPMTRFGVGGLAALAMFAVGTGNALAADDQNQFVLRGFGAQSCADGIAVVKADPARGGELASWLTGYVTALNRHSAGTYDLVPFTDLTPLLQIVVGMCETRPGVSIEAVLNDVLRRTSVARIPKSSPMVEATSGGKTVQVRAATLAALQDKLIQLKLFKGPADGLFSSKTEAALKKYQKSQKVEQTGLPDSGTILRLLIEPPAAAPAEEPEEKPKKGKKR